MTHGKKWADRRRFTRFRVPTNAFAFFGSRSAKLGQLIDISIGGLSFKYIADVERPYTSRELDILLPGGAFYLAGVPFRTISDYGLDGEREDGLTTRRCGVEFGPLTEAQKIELNYFIEYYSSADGEPSASQ